MSYSFAIPWTLAFQAPLSMEFPRQEYQIGLPFLSPGDIPHPGIESTSPVWAGRFFTTEPPEYLLLKLKSFPLKLEVAMTIFSIKEFPGLEVPWWLSGKESICQCRRHGFDTWSGKIPHAAEQLSPCTTTRENLCVATKIQQINK